MNQSVIEKLKKEIKLKLSTLKTEIEIEAQQDNHYYCWGCGLGTNGLDKSHILSVKQRKDLELEKANINLLCRKCHMNWESNDIEKMIVLHCFEKDLLYISKKDPRRYNQTVLMINDWLMRMFDLRLIDENAVNEELYSIIYKFGEKFSYLNS